jgi:hypothetical protein
VGPEQKLYKKLKAKTPKIIWNRIENLAIPGMPDLLGYNTNGHFFTVELKVTKGKKLKFSPHQIAFHVAHPNNTFILAEALGPRSRNRFHLYRGSCIMELEPAGLTLEACCLELDACNLLFEKLGA